jgi:threonine synthase
MIRFWSTLHGPEATIDTAILEGISPDGSLYIPTALPQIDWQAFSHYNTTHEFAYHLLNPFFQASQIDFNRASCKQIFNIPMPLFPLGQNQYFLELFHGPTLSFKDFGARFFGACLDQLSKDRETTVLVATSGDTGSAVAAGCSNHLNIKAVILFPYDQITPRQRAQMTTWGKSITALAVKGTFDDCQRLVKSALADKKLHKQTHLTTANSINIARLLPQMLFYAFTSCQLKQKHHKDINFIVPSGNLGNVTDCYWAKQMGFPIGTIWIATNENKVICNYLETGHYKPKPSIQTLASAMDVGNPSNLERLQALFGDFHNIKHHMNAASTSNTQIELAIKHCYTHYHHLICPHTAAAYHRLEPPLKSNAVWVAVATAHPAKFERIIEPLLNVKIPLPQSLKTILARQESYTTIEPQLSELSKVLASI